MTSHGYKQNEISQELSMGTKIFKTSYYTVLKAFSFKKIKILMTVPLFKDYYKLIQTQFLIQSPSAI
jgi:hypothetical protein